MAYTPKYSPTSLADAQRMYDEAVEAEIACLQSQEYSIANRNQRRALLDSISQRVKYWGAKVEKLGGDITNSPTVQRVVPRPS